MLLKEVKAERIPDSRGEPTIKVIIDGVAASSPSGKSTGKYETKQYSTSLEFSIDEINHLNFDFEVKTFDDFKKQINKYRSVFLYLTSLKSSIITASLRIWNV